MQRILLLFILTKFQKHNKVQILLETLKKTSGVSFHARASDETKNHIFIGKYVLLLSVTKKNVVKIFERNALY